MRDPITPEAPTWRRTRGILWAAARLLWVIGDLAIIVHYLTAMHEGDAQLAVLVLTYMWTAPLGTLGLYLYELLGIGVGSSFLGYSLTLPGETVLNWLFMSAAGAAQYFLILPYVFRMYARQERLSLGARLLQSIRVLLISAAGLAAFIGLKLLVFWPELRRHPGPVTVAGFTSLFSRLDLDDKAFRLEWHVLWPLALCFASILYVWLVRRVRMWHFVVLAYPAASMEQSAFGIDFWGPLWTYWAWVAGLVIVLRFCRNRFRLPPARQTSPGGAET